MAMAKKKSEKKTKIHEELSGFNIRINEFGEIETTFEIEKINTFLNENVDDKKLRDQKDNVDEENKPQPE